MNAAELREEVIYALMQALPVPACSALGAALSLHLGQKAHPAQDARARALLRRLYPDLQAHEIDSRLREVWRGIGRSFAEFAALPRLETSPRSSIEGQDNLAVARATGRPVILAFVHLGNWEVAGIHMGQLYPNRIMVIVELPANRLRARVAAEAHARRPGVFVDAGPTMWRRALAHLENPDHMLWLAADGQEAGICHFPGFGTPVPATSNAGKLVRLAHKAGALIVPFYNERHAHARFTTHILPAFDPAGLSVPAALSELEARFEPAIRRLVTQWYMAIHVPD
jgi:KDO2-lipid IV(A) lauroyltransferase